MTRDGTRERTGGTLEALGLRSERVLQHAEVRLPAAGTMVGRAPGRAAAGLAMLAAAGFPAGLFVPAEIEPVSCAGLKIEWKRDEPSVIRVYDPGGVALEQKTVPPDPNASRRDARDALRSVYFDLRALESAEILAPDGTAIVMALRGQTLSVDRLELATTWSPEPLAPISSPVLYWCGEARDPWLTAEVERLVAQRDSWSAGVAVGLYARVRALERAADAPAGAGGGTSAAPSADAALQRTLERAHRVMDSPGFTAPRRWARSLGAAERSTLEDLGLAELHRLSDRLVALEDAFEPGDSAWQHEFADLCEGRDDLECILFVLRAAGSGEALSEAVAAFDEDAWQFMASLPFDPRLEDERLRRASIIDPGAWWADPAASDRRLG